MGCGECKSLVEAKELCWERYRHQKNETKVGLFNATKSTEEIEQLLEDYKVASARLRYHVAVHHRNQGSSVKDADFRLLADDDGRG